MPRFRVTSPLEDAKTIQEQSLLEKVYHFRLICALVKKGFQFSVSVPNNGRSFLYMHGVHNTVVGCEGVILLTAGQTRDLNITSRIDSVSESFKEYFFNKFIEWYVLV